MVLLPTKVVNFVCLVVVEIVVFGQVVGYGKRRPGLELVVSKTLQYTLCYVQKLPLITLEKIQTEIFNYFMT